MDECIWERKWIDRQEMEKLYHTSNYLREILSTVSQVKTYCRDQINEMTETDVKHAHEAIVRLRWIENQLKEFKYEDEVDNG